MYHENNIHNEIEKIETETGKKMLNQFPPTRLS